MTKLRIYGDDSPFGDWLRKNPRLDSQIVKLSTTDVDFLVHKWDIKVDGCGERSLHMMLLLEVKTHGGLPDKSQQENIWFMRQLIQGKRRRLRDLRGTIRSVWSFGYYVLSLSGERPDASDRINWCSFDVSGQLDKRAIAVDELESILRFDCDPDTLRKIGNARRHHKTQRLILDERQPLGFAAPCVVTRRS